MKEKTGKPIMAELIGGAIRETKRTRTNLIAAIRTKTNLFQPWITKQGLPHAEYPTAIHIPFLMRWRFAQHLAARCKQPKEELKNCYRIIFLLRQSTHFRRIVSLGTMPYWLLRIKAVRARIVKERTLAKEGGVA